MIDKLWNNYKNKVVPPDASAIQIIETRRAFYAGASELFCALIEKDEDGKDLHEDILVLAAIGTEVEQFADEMIREARGFKN